MLSVDHRYAVKLTINSLLCKIISEISSR